MLKTEMKSKTDKQTWEKQTQNQRATKQKLIMEFTPSTGLRLWVPLQWVLIQLISLKWYKNGSGINFSNCKQNVVQSLQDLSSGNYN